MMGCVATRDHNLKRILYLASLAEMGRFVVMANALQKMVALLEFFSD